MLGSALCAGLIFYFAGVWLAFYSDQPSVFLIVIAIAIRNRAWRGGLHDRQDVPFGQEKRRVARRGPLTILRAKGSLYSHSIVWGWNSRGQPAHLGLGLQKSLPICWKDATVISVWT